MTTEKQLPAETIKTYRPWVGVVLSFFITGTSQFLAGKRRVGIAWFVSLHVLTFFAFFCLASPLFSGDGFAFAVFIFAVLLWLIMLVQSYEPIPNLGLIGWLGFIVLWICLSIAVAMGMRVFIQPFKIPTGSMWPTFRGDTNKADGTMIDGDRIVIEKFAYWFSKPQRGDIIVFKTANLPSIPLPLQQGYYLKRIIGVPGDVLSIQNGHLYNNGKVLSQPPILAKLDFPTPIAPPDYLQSPTNDYKVPDGCYFVIGDNTTNSYDSRYFGAMPQKSIIGKVSKICWPLARAGIIQ
jgi:signal peptidase I